ncbi:PTS sorbitol IIB subunit [Mediterraneibacter massiliensis]|jgi:PTS system galactitol-specific IIB component|uniref:PTS sorbitol IIB subunit n=1 Tax=Mediterraneibacter massiliensis TaxID=1720300 RepID=UPI0022E4D435|nr:PTS sorbitol IIB subunit [Mediterraneibacter massiliensis]
MRTVRMAVCCGGGIFTTSVVTEQIEILLKKKGIPYKITPQKLAEIPGLTGLDVIVATGKTSAKNGEGTPVLIGLPMFTGVGKEEFSELLIKTIHERVGE